jgi:hypothetical protein
MLPPPLTATSMLKLCVSCEPNFFDLSLFHDMFVSLMGSSVVAVATVLDCSAA